MRDRREKYSPEQRDAWRDTLYWTILEFGAPVGWLTTVGYEDVSPHTPLGKTLASLVMILGYSIIAVPTGIVTVEMSQAKRRSDEERSCPQCGKTGHDNDARFCNRCGGQL
ncbi:MAG: Ion channel [Candidatus Latescibacteria bacterium ADurb.Bin168]|nr:MAG: Ion channel [Candidatus Latescibacteria bacterium ADurb.Bin168]